MAQNKQALIRYRTIDKCLQNHDRTWTLDDLMAECSKELSLQEGKDSLVSKRTIQLDLQIMRSVDFYNAPIAVYERKYYRYADPKFTIAKLPLTTHDKDLILESLTLIAQFENFTFFNDFRQSVTDLIEKVSTDSAKQQSGKAEKIVLQIENSIKEKILSNPLHPSQKIIETKEDGSVLIQLKVHHNYELERLLLGFGPSLVVHSPNSLKRRIKKMLKKAVGNYKEIK